mgnify:FL=1
MFKTDHTVRTLKTIAMVAGLATVFWSLGLPYLQLAGAANITSVSDTLSDSAPSAPSNHTILFNATTGVLNTQSITVTFPAGFATGSADFSDIDLSGNTQGAFTVAATCSGSEDVRAACSGLVLTLTFCAGDGGLLDPDEEVTLLIGTNATGGNAQMTNPVTPGSYEVTFTSGPSDSGATRVAIIDDVTVTAAVDTIFTFTVDGVGSGQTVNGVTTTGVTSSTTIPFGTLVDGVASTTAQDLSVSTNASNGYVVTVQIDGGLQSSTGADIDGFVDGSYTDTPATWSAPSGTLGSENTYGHWGMTSDDFVTGRASEFATSTFASASTTPRIVMGHDGPADGTTPGVGTARVGYKVEITGLQEAGDDYTTTLTYVATPTF